MILVVGSGHVGLTCAVALAAAGHEVVAVEVDAERRSALQAGRVPFDEPGLEAGLAGVHIGAEVDATGAAIVLLAVPTPADASGPGLGALTEAAASIASTAAPGTLVLVKSTVPPGTSDALQAAHPALRVVANPEFLRVGHALHDLRHPARVVLGGAARDVSEVEALWRTVVGPSVVVVATTRATAELSKLAANAMLAVRIAFVNELSDLAAVAGADPVALWDAVGRDPRIGSAYLSPSPGFGGVCLPKDVHLLAHAGRALGAAPSLVVAAQRANDDRAAALLACLVDRRPRSVAVWGLGFRPGSADPRGSVPVWIRDALVAAGVPTRCWDPLDPGCDPVETVTEGVDAVFVGSAVPADPTTLRPRSRWVLDPAGLVPATWAAAGWWVARSPLPRSSSTAG